MNPGEIDWRDGQVSLWDLDLIDERRPLTEQVAALKEDLAQITYPAGVLLDVGWYPEFSKDGNFVVSIVLRGAWEQPLFQGKARTVAELKERLDEGARVAARAAADAGGVLPSKGRD